MKGKSKKVTGRGRRPIGANPMTNAERKKRYRAKLVQEGGKEYTVKVEGIHGNAVRFLSETTGISENEILRQIFSNALDRLVGVLNRASALRASGASEEAVEAFLSEQMYPPLPDVPAKEVPHHH